MNKAKETGILLAHALVLWALCGAIMGIGMAVVPEQTAIIIHAIAAPFIAAAVSWVYFTRFNYTTPLQTALVFVLFVIVVDFFLVGLLIQGSLEMFKSFLGTQLPFGLIMVATLLVGLYVTRK
jgi:hypothetical protein